MYNIASNIRQIREQKGYSQEYMAVKLGMEQPTYSRIESNISKLKLDRLQEIADILDTDISAFFDSKVSIQNQTNNDHANGYVENLYIENKEATKKLVQNLENENQHLKKEIDFLRSIIKKNNTC